MEIQNYTPLDAHQFVQKKLDMQIVFLLLITITFFIFAVLLFFLIQQKMA